MNEKTVTLSPRLRAAADMVRVGSFVADVGTDHAYLPIALCLEGRIRGGVASDINEGPVERGRKNINTYALGEKISTLRADGLDGLEKYSPDDILILGMGGELIARILSDAPWTKNEKIRLCLQPMTHPEALRAFLCQNGYEIFDETAVAEDGRIYQIISAGYTGKSYTLTEAELLLGKINIAKRSEALLSLAERTAATLMRRAEGKQSAGADASHELALIEKINEITEEQSTK